MSLEELQSGLPTSRRLAPLFSLEFGDAVIGGEPRRGCSKPRAS